MAASSSTMAIRQIIRVKRGGRTFARRLYTKSSGASPRIAAKPLFCHSSPSRRPEADPAERSGRRQREQPGALVEKPDGFAPGRVTADEPERNGNADEPAREEREALADPLDQRADTE